MESHRFRISWSPNRKIQYIESKKRGTRQGRKLGGRFSIEEELKNEPATTKSTVDGNYVGPGASFLLAAQKNAGSGTKELEPRVDLAAVGFRQDGARLMIPEDEPGAGILGGDDG